MNLRYLLGLALGLLHIGSGDRRRKLQAILDSPFVFPVYSHHPDCAVLVAVLDWLAKNGFHFVTADELISIAKGQKSPDPRSVWLSFDDGWKSNLTNVIPVLRERRIPATFFIAPQASIDGFVWTSLLPGGIDPQERAELFKLGNAERLALYKNWLKSTSKQRLLISPEDLKVLSREGLFSLENHTLTHCACAVMEPEETLAEVEQADSLIKQWAGRQTTLMCYPFGRYSIRGDKILRSKGFIPVLSQPGLVGTDRICRNLFYDTMSVCENSCRIVRAWRSIQDPIPVP